MKKYDFSQVKGQYHIKRGLEVSAVGDHAVLLIGCHKSGKDMLVERYHTIVDEVVVPIYKVLPCPCGYFTHPKVECKCTPIEIQRHLAKLPQEVISEVDIHLEVPVIDPIIKRVGEGSKVIKERVLIARGNSRPSEKDLSKEGEDLLKMAILEIGLSCRAYDKVLKVACTIAQMDSSATITASHISESIGYRNLDRNLWA